MKALQQTIQSFINKHFYSAFLLAALGLFVTAPSSHAETGFDSEPNVTEEIISFVNVNSADVSTLSLLKGIGESKALAIIEYRETFGKFESIDELTEVKGIGESTIEKNRGVITL